MAEARAVKFCTQVGYIKSYQKNKKSPPKWAWFGSRDPFCMRNCRLRKISPRHAVSCDQQCRRRWASVSLTYGDTLRLKLDRFDFLLQTCLFKRVVNKSTKWSLDFTAYVCANNWHLAMCFKYRSQRLLPGDFTCVQCATGDFAWDSVARSIGVSRCTC